MKRLLTIIFFLSVVLMLSAQQNNKVIYYSQNNTGFPVSPHDFTLDNYQGLIVAHLHSNDLNPGGITIFDGLRWKLISKSENNFPFEEVFKVIYSSNDGSIYAFGSTMYNYVEEQRYGIIRFDNGTQTWSFIGDSTLCDNYLNDMVLDDNGELFFSNDLGFFKVSENNCTKYYPPDTPWFTASKIVLKPDGGMYLLRNWLDPWATPFTGLYYFNGQTDPDTLKEPLDSINRVSDMVLDKYGNLWLLQENIIVQYNGGIEKVFHVSAGEYALNKCMAIDGDILWIGSTRGKLISFNVVTHEVNVYNISTFISSDVRKIIVSDNYLFIFTYPEGIMKFDKSTGNIVEHWGTDNTGIPSAYITSDITTVKFDKYNRYWINSLNHGIAMFNGDYWKTFSTMDICGNEHVCISKDLALTSNGYTVIVCDSLRYWSQATGWRSVIPPEDLAPYFNGVSVTTDNNNRVWIADGNYGLYKFDIATENFSLYEDDETGGRGPSKVFIDKDNNLWIGFQYAAPTVYDGSSFHHFEYSDGIEGDNTTDIAQAPDGSIWFSFYNNGIAKYSNGTWTSFTQANSNIPLKNIKTIAVDRNGKIWIASQDSDTLSAYYSLDGTNWEKEIFAPNINSGILDISIDVNNNLFISTPNNGVFVYNDNDVIIDVKDQNEERPKQIALCQNYPNPFNPTTTIKYSIPYFKGQTNANLSAGLSNVTLKVYDILGRKVATLVNEQQSPGNYEVKFDASKLSSGIYFYVLKTGSFVLSKKMILMK